MRLTTRELRLEKRRVETGGSSEAGVWQTSYSNRLERRGDTNKKRVRLQKKRRMHSRDAGVCPAREGEADVWRKGARRKRDGWRRSVLERG